MQSVDTNDNEKHEILIKKKTSSFLTAFLNATLIRQQTR